MRYSDSVSSDALTEVEAGIRAVVDELQSAIPDDDSNVIKPLSRKPSAVSAERKRLCKLNKQ